ncbi:MAG TPA: hypothetical protein VOB72_17735, partial [Candidatus Dormibacteraeota bacterium]|nr:hypothetical protein [Candidatus Dormibacteraeota bacterium]
MRRTTARPARTGGSTARRSSGRSRRAKATKPSVPLLTPTQAREGAGLLLVGLGLLGLVSVLVGGGPMLDRLREDIQGAFGFGWPLPIGTAIALGALWIWPRPLPLHRAHIVAGLVGALALLGLLSVADRPAGGALGYLVAHVIASLAGSVGAALILTLVLLLVAIVTFRLSVGTVLVAVVATGRAAYAERQRLEALVRRPEKEALPEAATIAPSPRKRALAALAGVSPEVAA